MYPTSPDLSPWYHIRVSEQCQSTEPLIAPEQRWVKPTGLGGEGLGCRRPRFSLHLGPQHFWGRPVTGAGVTLALTSTGWNETLRGLSPTLVQARDRREGHRTLSAGLGLPPRSARVARDTRALCVHSWVTGASCFMSPRVLAGHRLVPPAFWSPSLPWLVL